MERLVAGVESLTFNEWRARYWDLTGKEQLEYLNAVCGRHPNQYRVNEKAAKLFFDRADARRVFEVGGYDGALARMILAREPEIVCWINCDPYQGARRDDLDRYFHVAPEFYWFRGDWAVTWPDTLVFSHVLEHFPASDVDRIVGKFPSAKWMYVDCPLPAGPPDWSGYDGTHILEAGWDGLNDLLEGHGFGDTGWLRGEQRAYRRDHPDDSGQGGDAG